MNRFPVDYATHNLPLLFLSGLDTGNQTEQDLSGRTHNFLHEGGFRIKVDLPVVQGPLARRLLQAFRDQDGSNIPWHSHALLSKNGRVFKILTVGRVYTLPPRKAPPPPHSPRLSATVANGSPPSPLVLHSPLSPLTPSSPLYPDGIISSLWITKHQSRLPCAFFACFSFTSDPNTSSLRDNKLKAEINHIRSVFSSTHYKTRLVVLLLGDGNISPSDAEDRFNNIRRATALDGRSIHFLPYDSSSLQVVDFVNSVLSILHPFCVDYYRDLSKHARRKRNRNSVPPPTVQPGTSRVLSLRGWNVRYEFKLGVLAEFRQEMDAACRNYETAYESLFGPEIIDAIAIWSPRFNEARLLADIIALRTIRCLLWTDQGTTAVRSWIMHRNRVRDLVNRRGKGTESYGWEAWQTAWAMVMADLLSRSEYPLLNIKIPGVPDILPIFAGVDKSLPAGERSTPWEQLPHEGYWLDMARRSTVARRKWALQIPEEDRQPPGRSPASMVASKAHLYDTYLALEPYREVPTDGTTGYKYEEEIMATLDTAIQHFAKRGQVRKIEVLGLQKALEQIEMGSWADAISTLRPLWSSQNWRTAGWWKLLQLLGWTLLDCLAKVKEPELVIQLLWELSNNVFDRKPGIDYDLRHAITALGVDGAHPSVAIDMDRALSPLVPSFAFSTHNVFVGEPLECQLCIQSRAQTGLRPIQLTEVKIVFEGGLKPVYLVAGESQDAEATSSGAEFVDVCLQESTSSTLSRNKRSSAGSIASQTGRTNLTIPSNHTTIFRFRVVPREAGEISIASITLLLDEDDFSLAVTTSDFEHAVAQWWETKGGNPIARPLGQESNAYNRINVQPKPPNLQIEALGLRRTYYTSESISIDLDIVNHEEDDAIVSIESRMISPVAGAAQVRWSDSGADHAPGTASASSITALPPRELGTIPSSGKKAISLRITDTVIAVDHEVEVIATYRLTSEPETILTKSVTIDVGIIRPFEANYEFTPRLDDDPWPSFFEAPPSDADSSSALGLRHKYSVAANLYSFATEPLVIEAILLTAHKIAGGAICSSSNGIVRAKTNSPETGNQIAIPSLIRPDQTECFDLELSVQKLTLGDRHTVGVDLALEIGWHRQDSQEITTTVLEVPRLVAPMAEPRVMLKTSETSLSSSNVPAHRLTFMIENPSMHFLTFNVAMEASEDFAFSGPKACALSLVPISRQTLTYRILPNKKDEWIEVHLNVVDAYFGQTLRVLPGGDGVKMDKKGNVLIKV
ncbi:uncharacterized protein Z518_02741 [Rhinocladiella mackenziei CBS 650.93]|uniref:Trafficking protein particle complex subunit 11 n=1 Tax=Rhinocladiella mackenziei CBS 650.93 TaxID=1442369 RepID=A0A0D2IXL4_9EURO|nr:uncharacterized protein Z518_02741 [Rhinocladiella mackenziei CBS 650.93]KIX08086.1 hypothetical protein Z518_02741 [Rhinocladiella mackenziei CBS 650.93]